MRIPDDTKKEILDFAARNIAAIIGEYVSLKPAGKDGFQACCPFHVEKTPSFTVSPSRGTWRCFGACSEGGDAAKFLMKMEGINFYEALLKLAERAGISIAGHEVSREEKERKAILAVLAKAEAFYRSLLEQSDKGKRYVESRMTASAAVAFGTWWVKLGVLLYLNLPDPPRSPCRRDDVGALFFSL